MLLYKLADQLTQALTRPFLIDMGYSADHRGIALATVGMVATIAGAFVGGWVTTLAGLGHSLWIFGFLQIFSNLGYYFVSLAGGPNLPLMYGATSFELFTSGLGTGAFSVLLLRMTQKRFSATQYALFSSLFALPRLLAGPIAGFAVDAIGWPPFFLSTLVMGIPGLVMLARFAPLGVREPEFTVEEVERKAPLGAAALAARARRGAVASGVVRRRRDRAACGAEDDAGDDREQGSILSPRCGRSLHPVDAHRLGAARRDRRLRADRRAVRRRRVGRAARRGRHAGPARRGSGPRVAVAGGGLRRPRPQPTDYLKKSWPKSANRMRQVNQVWAPGVSFITFLMPCLFKAPMRFFDPSRAPVSLSPQPT